MNFWNDPAQLGTAYFGTGKILTLNGEVKGRGLGLRR